jgi:hypothetical protein
MSQYYTSYLIIFNDIAGIMSQNSDIITWLNNINWNKHIVIAKVNNTHPQPQVLKIFWKFILKILFLWHYTQKYLSGNVLF